MALAKRKEVVTALEKQNYGGILLAPALNGDNNLTFKLKAGKKEVAAVVFFPDSDGGEYGCMLGDDFDDLGKGDPLAIVNKLVTDFAKKNGLQLPGAAPAAGSAAALAPAPAPVPKASPRKLGESSGGDWRNESTDSWRHESNGSDGGDDLHNEWARAEVEAEAKWQENVDLVRDVNNHKNLLGESSITVKPLGALEVVNVELNVQLRDVIDDNIGVAWGVDVKVPLVISLSFSFYYLDSSAAPKLELFQVKGTVKDKVFKLRSQLTSIVSTFVSREWPLWSGKKRPAVQTFASKDAPKEPKAAPAPADAKGAAAAANKPGFLGKLLGSKEKREVETVMDGAFKKPVSSPPPKAGANAGGHRDAEIAQLCEMGFTIEVATAALNTTKNFDEALALLLAGGADATNNDGGASAGGPMTKLPAPKPISSKFMDELAKASASEHKYIADYGFLVALHSYLKGRVATLSNYCVICDQPHVFGNMLKPAVCTRELCCWSFQQLGVGAGSADEIATAAEVVDLLVSFASAAANSPRKDTIFDPYPTIMDPRDSKKALLSPQAKDFAKLCEVLNKMPSIEKIANAKDAGDMKSILDRAHPLANDMLSWIISSNRSHIVKIPKEKHVKSMNTPHQYLLMSAPPEKEAKFRDLRAKHGSVFAFHGSSTENWHCILRLGLKNASGTKLQVNGAAYGAGIYLSPAASVSFGYSRMYGHGARPNANTAAGSSNRFLVSSSVFCIAICEVINTGDIRKSGDIWVQPHEDHVLTRFFFVYVTPDPGTATQNHCSKKEFETELRTAMDLYGH